MKKNQGLAPYSTKSNISDFKNERSVNDSRTGIKNKSAGFTIIEMIVSISILVVLSSILGVYSRSSERQLILVKEQAKVLNAISRSKSLTMQGLELEFGTSACGYGVYFYEANGNYNYAVSKYSSTSDPLNCSDLFGSFSRDSVQADKLDSRVKFSPGLPTDIVFIAPEPTVKFNPVTADSVRTIKISTIDNTSSACIKVNKAGQTSFLNICN